MMTSGFAPFQNHTTLAGGHIELHQTAGLPFLISVKLQSAD
jgi:hypothetical protein